MENWKVNKAAYNVEYNKENMKQVKIALHKENQADVLEWLDSKENKTQYILELIREDMKKAAK